MVCPDLAFDLGIEVMEGKSVVVANAVELGCIAMGKDAKACHRPAKAEINFAIAA